MSETNRLEHAIQCFHEGRYSESKVLFEQLQKSSPELLMARVYLAQLAVLEGEGKSWVSAMKEVVILAPYLADAYYVLGLGLQQAKQLPEASEVFHKALALVCLEEGQVGGWRLTKQPSNNVLINEGEKLLWQTLAQLKQHGVHAFASAGTLLGLEREGQLLDQDKDLDIGIDWLQMSSAIAVLEANGWKEASRSYDLINPRCFKHTETLITLDICGFGTDVETGEAISGLWMQGVPFHWNRVTYFPNISLTERDSPAGKIWHLTEPDALLCALYGPEWRTPDTDFDTIVCAQNLRTFSWLARCYGYARVYIHWRRGNLSKVSRMVDALLAYSPQDTVLSHVKKRVSEAGRKRVLALGFFDLFHHGHLNYLHFARKFGSSLIVGVAPNHFSVKGKGYFPVIDESQRCSIVESLEIVDEVCLVEVPMAQTQAASEWIASLQVDVVVCGDEWRGSERWRKLEDALAKRSIKVVYAPKTDGISTSIIKDRILDK